MLTIHFQCCFKPFKIYNPGYEEEKRKYSTEIRFQRYWQVIHSSSVTSLGQGHDGSRASPWVQCRSKFWMGSKHTHICTLIHTQQHFSIARLNNEIVWEVERNLRI